jgi:hypothetical protein
MKPPICEVCDNDFRKDLDNNKSAGGLVSFADYTELPEGITGHPKGLAWFCAKHINDAKFLSNLSKSIALEQLRKKYQIF